MSVTTRCMKKLFARFSEFRFNLVNFLQVSWTTFTYTLNQAFTSTVRFIVPMRSVLVSPCRAINTKDIYVTFGHGGKKANVAAVPTGSTLKHIWGARLKAVYIKPSPWVHVNVKLKHPETKRHFIQVGMWGGGYGIVGDVVQRGCD